MLSNDKMQKDSVERQFSKRSRYYITSKVHSGGESLNRILNLAAPGENDYVLDIATGPGHTGIMLSKYTKKVIGLDISLEMLKTGRSLAENEKAKNICWVRADAEVLPFSDNIFDIITCRIAPHHFPDILAFLRESKRVLKKKGRIIVVDTWSPDDKEISDFLNTIEKLRDPTHLRTLSGDEWEKLFKSAGFNIEYIEKGPIEGMRSFLEWATIAGAGEEATNRIRDLLLGSNDRIRTALKITHVKQEIMFDLPRIVIYGKL